MENWKNIIGYEKIYQISDHGRIRNIQTGVYRKLSVINSGYQIFTLKSCPQRHRELVHRLVAKHFCQGYKPELDVNHKDGNRLNNHYKNLEWVTRKENIRDMMKRGTHDVKTAQQVAKIKNQKPVAQYTLEGKFVKEYPSAKEASNQVGLQIRRAASGSRETAAGFKWLYI